MFKVGDFVTGKEGTDHIYGITNSKSLCVVVALLPPTEMLVRTLGTGDSNNNFSLRSEYFLELPLSNHGTNTYRVDTDLFELETPEHWIARKGDNWGIDFHFWEIVKYYRTNNEKKGEDTMITMPTIKTNGTYEFTEANRKYFFDKAKELFDEYGHPYTDEGLQVIWDEFKANKQGVAAILSKHPKWNAEKMAIVFSQNYTRAFDLNKVKDFANWVESRLIDYAKGKEIIVGGCNYDELKTSLVYIKAIKEQIQSFKDIQRSWLDNITHNVIVDGKTIEEWDEEYYRILEMYDHINDISFRCFYGYRVTYEEHKKINAAKRFLSLLMETETHLLTAKQAKEINAIAEPFNRVSSKGNVVNFGAKEGMKLSRVVNKFFKNFGFDKITKMVKESWYDDHGNYHTRMKDKGWNGRFAEFADAINPFTITRHTIISVNPIDYLTMSFGNGWASCQTIDKENKRDADHAYEGMYCSGTLSYMLDSASFIMYTVNENYDGDDFCLQDKELRNVFHLGEDKLIQGRLYPDGRKADRETSMAGQFRNVMQKVISKCVGADNLWEIKKETDNCSSVIYTKGTHYPDYKHYDDCNVSFLKRNGLDNNMNRIVVGHNPICPVCGEEHRNEGILTCNDHQNGAVCCAHCGRPINIERDDYVYDEDTENYYCDDECADAEGCFYCNNVNEYHSENVNNDDYTGNYFYDRYGDDGIHVIRESGRDYHYVNYENAENDGWRYIDSDEEWHHIDDGEIVQCEHCGEWILISDTEDGTCPACGVVLDEVLDETVA